MIISHIYKIMKLKSKSILLKDTIEKLDEQLATIPTHDIQVAY